MLATDPRMQDIDTDQWRTLQSLLTVSAKARPRIIVLHEDGVVQKLAHSQGAGITGRIDTVDDPAAVARQLFEANSANTDFVAVFDRTAVDAYYARLQDSWKVDEDLDVYVHRSLELLDEFASGLVTHPGPARTQLGLQWRLGGSYEQIQDAVGRFVEPNSFAVFGAVADGRLDASLVLGFDGDRKICTITTAQPARISARSRADIATQVVEQVGTAHGAVSLGLFVDRTDAERLVREGVSVAALRDLAAVGALSLDPAPPALRTAMGEPSQASPSGAR